MVNRSSEAHVQGSITLSVDNNITDVLSVSNGYNLTFNADTAGSDKVVFWDHSASKLTYLTIGSGLEISGTTLSTPDISNDWLCHDRPKRSTVILTRPATSISIPVDQIASLPRATAQEAQAKSS